MMRIVGYRNKVLFVVCVAIGGCCVIEGDCIPQHSAATHIKRRINHSMPLERGNHQSFLLEFASRIQPRNLWAEPNTWLSCPAEQLHACRIVEKFLLLLVRGN